MKAEGPYFDELTAGQAFPAVPRITLTEGLAAVHQSITGDRLALSLDTALAEEVTGASAGAGTGAGPGAGTGPGAGRPANPALVWDVAIGQSTVATQHVKANLFYRGLWFRRFPVIGDTLRTTTRVDSLRQNRPREGRAPTGLAALRITTVDQHERPVLDFWRCAMLPLRDPSGQTGHADDLDAAGATANPTSPAALLDGWRLDRFAAHGFWPQYGDLVPGDVVEVAGGDVVSSAPELARLTLNIAAVHPHQKLRRRTHNVPNHRLQLRSLCRRHRLHAESQKVHIRRRVHDPQRAIDLKRIDARLTVEALREHALEDIARGDILLRLRHGLQERRLRGSRRQLQLSGNPFATQRRQSARQPLFQLVQPLHRALVGPFPLLACQVGRHHQVDLLLHMIEGDHLVEEHQAGVRRAQLVLRQRRQPLDLPNDIVRKKSHRPGRERRQPGKPCRFMPAQGPLQLFKDVALKAAAAALLGRWALFDRDRRPSRDHLLVRLDADEGVASDALAAFDRLQQKRLRLLCRDPQKCRNGRLKVCRYSPIHRHQRMCLRKHFELAR